jgi:hypothetical protein
MVQVRIEANVEWGFGEDPDSGSGEWIGICPMLNLNAVGDTFAEAQQCASEAMHLLFLDLFKTGQLAEFLRARGWMPKTGLPESGSVPRFDASYVTRLAPARELVPAADDSY